MRVCVWLVDGGSGGNPRDVCESSLGILFLSQTTSEVSNVEKTLHIFAAQLPKIPTMTSRESISQRHMHINMSSKTHL